MKERMLEIATGPNRMARRWRNIELTWAQLCERCKTPRRTGETVAEFAALDRQSQSNIKDVGGFVGGKLVDGLRRTTNVGYRTVLTLDADFATADFYERCKAALPGVTFMLYSTHKYTAEKPRLRLLVPLSRRTGAEEYIPLGRRVAADIGIDYFDQTSYEPARLMYWPSVSEDGEYYYKIEDGAALDVDATLARLPDWRDVLTWPRGIAEGTAPLTLPRTAGSAGGGKVADPRDKAGAVGAFCKAYDIHGAIAHFLPLTFLPTQSPGRYTYVNGSVAGGAVVYDDLWLYSHHDSDPWHGRLLNAFDLVRLHRFGDLDAGAAADAEMTQLASYREMVKLCEADGDVRRLMTIDTANRVAAELAGVDVTEAIEAEEADWREMLDTITTKNSEKVRDTANNVVIILEHDPDYRGRLWHDEFSGTDRVQGGLKWNPKATEWTNADDARLRVELEKKYGLSKQQRIDDALTEVFQRHRRHPVRDWLETLRWDGEPRLETLLTKYVGAVDSPYVRAVTRLHFVAAVARVYEPGCKYDYCLTLSGPEGVGKSTMLAIMFGDWFNDSLDTLDGKGPMEQLQNTWCAELAELSSMKKSEVERVKQFITSRADTYRGAYQRRSERHPRQCVFAATTNETNFLRSTTGNRRFNVVTVDPTLSAWPTVAERLEAIRRDRDQLWAEAVALYRKGMDLYLSEELATEARKRQEEHSVDAEDPLRARLEVYLGTLLPGDWDLWSIERRRAFYSSPDPCEAAGSWPRAAVCPVEFICEGLGIETKDMRSQRELISRVVKYLQDLGWERGTLSRRNEKLYGRQYDWKPVNKIDGENHN